MAVNYRFFGGGIDITLVTDARPGNKEFFVTQKISEDPWDVAFGINIEEKSYNEADFIQIAENLSLRLLRYDRTGESDLVVPGVTAGQFSGDSLLEVDGVNFNVGSFLADSIISEFTIWFSETDITSLGQVVEICSTENQEDALSIFFIVDEILKDPNALKARLILLLNGNTEGTSPKNAIPFTFTAQTLYKIRVEVTKVNNVRNFNVSINENFWEISSDTFNDSANTAPVKYNYGRLFTVGISGVKSLYGIMQDILLIVDGTTIIDIPDPSTGLNGGTAPDGVPINVSSVNVIK
jgi:hypothetical protein